MDITVANIQVFFVCMVADSDAREFYNKLLGPKSRYSWITWTGNEGTLAILDHALTPQELAAARRLYIICEFYLFYPLKFGFLKPELYFEFS